MSEETKKTSEEQEAEKEIPVTDGDQEEENLTPEAEGGGTYRSPEAYHG